MFSFEITCRYLRPSAGASATRRARKIAAIIIQSVQRFILMVFGCVFLNPAGCRTCIIGIVYLVIAAAFGHALTMLVAALADQQFVVVGQLLLLTASMGTAPSESIVPTLFQSILVQSGQINVRTTGHGSVAIGSLHKR